MAKKTTKATATAASAPVTLTGFPPLVGKNPTTLILAEFPGDCSLYTGLYYSHWGNSLRDIIADIFNNGIPFRKYPGQKKQHHAEKRDDPMKPDSG